MWWLQHTGLHAGCSQMESRTIRFNISRTNSLKIKCVFYFLRKDVNFKGNIRK